MSLPSLTRTWQFQVNANNPALGTAGATNQALMFALKSAFIGAGAWTDSAGAGTAATNSWVVVRSSDSVATDATDRWAAAVNLVWAVGSHSWIVLRQVGVATNYELCIDLNSATAAQATIVVSPAAGFGTGTIGARPTATDQIILVSAGVWGGAVANVSTFLHVLKSADGAATRVAMCRSGFVSAYWLLEQPGQPVAGWANPSLTCLLADNASATTVCTISALSNTAVIQSYSTNSFTSYLTGLCTRTHGLLATNQAVANDIGAEFPFFEQGIYSVVPNGRGRNGSVVDQWWGLAALADSDVYPAGGTRNFLQLGDIIWPWNTTAPSFGGGASTNRAGESITQSPEWFSMYLAPVAGGPDAATISTGTVMYQMEAWDSVTGAQYTWVSTERDFSGAGYPGPNAPTDVAVAAIIEAG